MTKPKSSAADFESGATPVPEGATEQGQNGSEAFPAPTKEEIVEARAEGVKDAIRESHKEAYMRGANEGYGDAPASGPTIVMDRGVFQLQDLLDLDVDALAERVSEKNENPITEGKIAGLLEVERSGKNRTDYVKVLMDRLGIKSPYEVTSAGPAFTNDTTPTTKL
jgi:hypothetical protein